MHDLAHIRERNRIRTDEKAAAFKRELHEVARIMRKVRLEPPVEPWEQIKVLHYVAGWPVKPREVDSELGC